MTVTSTPTGAAAHGKSARCRADLDTSVMADDRLQLLAQLTLPTGEKLGETWERDPWLLERVLLPILAVGDDGLPVNPHCFLELARGHAKTSTAGALAIAEVLLRPATEVVAIASDYDQAALLRAVVAGQTRRHAQLRECLRPVKDGFEVNGTGSRIKIMSSDVPSFFGLGVDCRRLRIIADELGMWGSRDLFDAAITTLPKVADSQIVILSNAGIKGSWQEEVRAEMAANGYLFSSEGVIASWIRPADLERARRSVPEAVYQRFYENRWLAEEGDAIPMEWWDACLDPALRPLDAGTQAVIGVDAGIASDSFAIVVVTRHPTRPQDSVAVRDVAIWTPDGGSIDFEQPLAWLTRYVAEHHIVQICFDPFQLHYAMQKFSRETRTWCLPFQQGPDRAKADSDLYQIIRDRRLAHSGNERLRAHIANCAFKMAVGEDTRARLVKAGRGKIDAAIALSMGASEALRLYLT